MSLFIRTNRRLPMRWLFRLGLTIGLGLSGCAMERDRPRIQTDRLAAQGGAPWPAIEASPARLPPTAPAGLQAATAPHSNEQVTLVNYVESPAERERNEASAPDPSPTNSDREAPLATRPAAAADAPLGEPGGVIVEFGEMLSIASGRNPTVNFANERVRESFTRLQQAEVLWLPMIRLGANYHYRTGVIQNAQGLMFDTERNSVFGGLGSRVVGGGAVGIPGVQAQFHLADAVFQPEIARQAWCAQAWRTQAVLNDTLLEVALAYLRLLHAVQEEAIAAATYDDARLVKQLCDDFAAEGLTPRDNADRAATDVALRYNQMLRARENVKVASADLVRLMSGDPSLPLLPLETGVAPIELIDEHASLRELVALGLSQRPELHESKALVKAAVERLNRERYSSLMPGVLLGMTYGGMAGGQGGYTGNGGDRFDFDVGVFWELRQLGLGDRAIRAQARSQVEQSRWQQVQLMDQVATEISTAHAQAQARHGQIAVAQTAVEYAVLSFRRNLERIRQGEGLPIEVLQSLQALDASRREYLKAVVDYNEAQFRLYRAIGWKIDGQAAQELSSSSATATQVDPLILDSDESTLPELLPTPAP